MFKTAGTNEHIRLDTMRVNSLGITEGVCIWELLRLQTCNTLRLKIVNGENSEVLEFCVEPLVDPNLEQHNQITIQTLAAESGLKLVGLDPWLVSD